VSLENLRTFPWVAEREAEGSLALHGCSFDIPTGVLRRMRPDGVFEPVPA
jgi:carbonic anhydrase